ncbi:MAG: hypothetical protein CSA52_02805 [Gammaproteobacteria bacterium]|nr:MAG: hypothetical protein CSB48_04475 [Pseudomonadota bacterium]PIE38330.1 MAG: hypothetical protein CSA52_02805 [Gammaproteobacteria bacterium]
MSINHTASPWITCYVPRPYAAVRLICIPHGGGGPQSYKTWAEQLPEHIEVLALGFPGRGSRYAEAAIHSMPPLADGITEALKPFLDKPYALFGHSVGALVAYEAACRIRATGLMQPMRLIVSAHETPENSYTDQPMYTLSDSELLDKIGALGLVPEDAMQNTELVQFILPALRADFELSETYTYRPSEALALPVTAMLGVDDPLLNKNAMQQWEKYTTAAFTLRCYQGDHFYTVSAEQQVLDDIAAELTEDLQQQPASILEGEVVDYPQQCLHELFREQARQYPQRTAVVDIHQSLTFAVLDEQTDLLARELQRRGVVVDSIVSIFMESSVEYVVACLAILKAGGAYMPLEVAYPQAMLQKVLQKTTPVSVLTTKAYRDALPDEWQSESRTLLLDNGWVASLSARDLPELDVGRTLPQPDSLAYCVMTSGTTGEPKGIICPHRGAVNSYYWRYRNYPYQPDEREAANVFFVWEVIRPLLQGMPAYVIPDDVIYDPWQLVDFLEEHAITRVLFTPSLLEQILHATDTSLRRRLSRLRIVWLNGEVVPTTLCQRFFERLPDTRLLNDYSISETHDVCTHDLAQLNTEYSPRFASAGYPMSNVRIYLLDENLKPVPRGMTAEIYIGGDSLARGYLKEPEKTAERFIIDPLRNDGALLFRTGDQGRVLPNGELEVTGRIEFMIKLRGYSIVPGAIEAAINEYPAVDASVVVTRDDEQTGQPEALVAYVVGDNSLPDEELQSLLRQHLKEVLPHYAVPAYLTILETLPLNQATGKLDRKQLPKPETATLPTARASSVTTGKTEQVIMAAWETALGIRPTAISDNFFDLGGHSLLAIQVCRALSQQLGMTVSVIDIFENPTVQTLAAFIDTHDDSNMVDSGDEQASTQSGYPGQTENDDIAIIGLAGRFPGADNIDDFWSNIRSGVCSIRELGTEELDKNGVPKDVYSDENYRRVGAILDNVDLFDPQFWQLSQKEANLMDPQQRLFLESCWHALEHAGYAPDQQGARTGVFGGCYSPLYLLHNLAGGGFMDPTDPMGYHLTETGNDKDYITTRVSYLLNLQGPSVAIQSSCSTALSVVASACQSLQAHQCDTALAGASSITFPQAGYQYVEGHINSRDGKIRTFDAKASGTILGDGVGVVVLKRLRDAVAAKDTIYAVIKGYATNNDGNRKAGYSAPGVRGQKAVVNQALTMAGVSADSISLVEAHGTGTLVGDPIETTALTEVFRQYSQRKNYCALGSVKPNIGHSNIAAGMASLMKVALSLHHREIPPTIHYDTPNPVMDIESSPFFINTETIPWETPLDIPRRAGVSCLGIGGTNNHFILQQAPVTDFAAGSATAIEPAEQRGHHLLLLSGKTPEAVQRNQAALANYLQKHSEADLRDVEFTLQTGRCHFDYRTAVACTGPDSAIANLKAPAKVQSVQVATEKQAASTAKTVFLFPGQGSQYQQMGFELYQTEPVFRRYFDECCDLLQPELGVDLRDLLFAPIGSPEADETFRYAYHTQPAIVAHQIAMARTLMDWGIRPDALVGHSIGEYTAACVAGIFSLPDTLKLIAARGRAMEQAGPGRMLSATLSENDARRRLQDHPGVSLGVINAPERVVFSGPVDAMAALQSDLKAQGIAAQPVNVRQAFHSTMMDEPSQALVDAVRPLKRHAPKIALMSNVTGTWMTEAQVFDDRYWAQHMRATVRFSDNVTTLLQQHPSTVLEVGAHTILSQLLRSFTITMQAEEQPLILACSRHPRDNSISDSMALDAAVGQWWAAGRSVDWAAYRGNLPCHRAGLPGYAFEPQRCWVDKGPLARADAHTASTDDNAIIADIAGRGFMPSWSRAAFPAIHPDPGEQRWLVFASKATPGVGQFSQAIIRALQQAGAAVEVVYAADFTTDDPQAWAERFDSLAEKGTYPDRVLYLWSLTGAHGEKEPTLATTYYPALNFAKGLALQSCLDPLQVWMVTDGTFQVDAETVAPIKSTLLGPAIVLPQECSQIACRLVDVRPEALEDAATQRRLFHEISSATPDVEPFVALRGSKRWVKRYEPFPVLPVTTANGGLREGGTYLITGGLGRIAGELCRALAERKARLVLSTTMDFPDRNQWQDYLEHSADDSCTDRQRIVAAIRQAQDLERAGAEVIVLSAHLNSVESVRKLIDTAVSRFGALHGIFHLAGLADLRYLPEMTVEISEREFQPKIDGLLYLEQVLGEYVRSGEIRPDFVMLFSSLAAILGGYGMTAYTAANRFMDTFVQVNPWRHGIRWYAVNWDDWDFDYGKEQVGAYEQTVAKYAMSAADGIATIERILSLPEPQQILVSTRALQPRVRQWLHQHETQNETAGDAGTDAAQGTPDASDLLSRICDVYREVLDMPDLSPGDNFFAVGGDSLLASQILLKLRRAIKAGDTPLTLACIFDYPSAQALADWLELAEK